MAAPVLGRASLRSCSALLLLSLLLSLPDPSSSTPSTISNTVPRVDEDGDIVDAGDGCITYDSTTSRYYLFGTRYQCCSEPDGGCYCGSDGCASCEQEGVLVPPGECCGWRNMTLGAWSSPDLVSWRKEGMNLLPAMTDPASPYSSARQAYFEPCAVYNRRSGFWVLWMVHPYVKGVAVSRAVGGPYTVVNWEAGSASPDYYLWLEHDTDTVLMKHNGGGGEYLSVLNEDFLSINATSPLFGTEFGYTEGGGVFVRNGSYFVMAGHGCCFCPLGSNGYLWTSPSSPVGNFTYLGDKIPLAPNKTSVTHAQQFGVTPLYTSSGTVPMFVGIRFGSAPDAQKCHDFQYWRPLDFNADGTMQNLTWLDSFTVDLVAPPPPPPVPTPPAPYYACSAGGATGQCVEVPQTAPGAYPTLAECQASCVLCDLTGTWFGTIPTIPISVVQAPGPSGAVTIAARGSTWPSNATGTVQVGYVAVTGGWCAAGTSCVGVIGGSGVAREAMPRPHRGGGDAGLFAPVDAAAADAPSSSAFTPCSTIVWGAGQWCKGAVCPTAA